MQKCQRSGGSGGANGFGKSLALKFAELGADVIIADIDSAAGTKSIQEITEKNVRGKFYKVDVSDNAQIIKFREDVVRDFGHVDILVNNTGLIDYFPLQESSMEDLERLIKINFTSHIFMIKAFISGMIERKSGHIVNISSCSAMYPFYQNIVYSATKFGINGFSLGLIEYLRAKKLDQFIKMTCIMPIFMNSRKEILDYLHPSTRIPVLKVSTVAKHAIKGILQERMLFSIPGHFKFGMGLMNLLPLKLQQVYRDIVLKDFEHKYDRN